jgi:hypothetical protein
MSCRLVRGPVAAAWVLAATAAGAAAEPDRLGNIDVGRAARDLAAFDSLCARDGGALWGVSFSGPMLIVDPATRLAVANRPDAGGRLAPRAGIFAGQLPPDVGIANTAVEWGGTRWTMIMWWSLGGRLAARLALMAHEAFHRLQPQLGLETNGPLNAHLDGAEGRTWLQLEWNALEQALLADGAARRAAIGDALAFRAARRAAIPEAAAREVPLEIFEGLAEYSGMRLAGFGPLQVVEAVRAKRRDETGFVRSFAYVSGPLYGYLLDATGEAWRRALRPDTDLGACLAAAHRLEPRAGEAEAHSAAYGGPALRAAEARRDTERQAQLSAWRKSLIDGPVLGLDLAVVTSGTFDPGRVFPFDDQRTVYTTRELLATWGRLVVRDGAILEDPTSRRGQVSLLGAAADHRSGAGWHLELAPGWNTSPGARPGDFEVRPEPR